MMMTTLLTAFTEFSTWLFTQAGEVLDLIISTPLLIIPCAIFAIGAGIGLVHRLMNN